MKRCPECMRDYYDDSLLYCLDDGKRLLDGLASGGATTIIRHDPDSPTLRNVTRSARDGANGNLDPIIGRAKELSEISDLLGRNVVRLVTLTGIGGTGKTRIARQISYQIGNMFSDGVFWVELASVSDPLLVATTIARALQVRETDPRSAWVV